MSRSYFQEFTIIRCATCGALDVPPREQCGKCGGTTLVPQSAAGSGRLVTWTVMRRPPAAFADEPPYAVAVVDLAEGVRVTGRLAQFEDDPPSGTPVTIVGTHKGTPVFAAVR
ncbi:MAG: Zn-ribbon domain-containing OB-fold protein [Alphaproteobacteria bacterium]